MRYLRSFVVAASLLTVAALGCDRGSHPHEVGTPAPDFTVSDGTSSVHLASYRGQVVLVNFWWSHCPPCIVELPSMLAFHRAHPEFPILGMNIDEAKDDYLKFVRDRHVDFLTVWDPKQTAATKFEVTGWPETFIVDRKGVIQRRFIGATDWNDPQFLQYLKTL